MHEKKPNLVACIDQNHCEGGNQMMKIAEKGRGVSRTLFNLAYITCEQSQI